MGIWKSYAPNKITIVSESAFVGNGRRSLFRVPAKKIAGVDRDCSAGYSDLQKGST